MKQRALLSVLVALMALAGSVQGVGAAVDWCETDPLEVIVTPAGSSVPVYVTNGALGTEHLGAVQLAVISYTVNAEGGGTSVKMSVLIPDDAWGTQYPTRTAVSTGPWRTGTLFDQATGISSRTMDMQFFLNVP